jgi:hypothetical protein
MISQTSTRGEDRFRSALLRQYSKKLIPNPSLNRSLVSFQANRNAPIYNWFKYKEGFSAEMVKHLIVQLAKKPGVLLDPFSGTGTALFAGRSLGWDAIGIEILPVGLQISEARMLAEQVNMRYLQEEWAKASKCEWEHYYDEAFAFRHVRITEKAFPKRTEKAIAGFLAYCHRHVTDPIVRQLMQFACMTILESIS